MEAAVFAYTEDRSIVARIAVAPACANTIGNNLVARNARAMAFANMDGDGTIALNVGARAFASTEDRGAAARSALSYTPRCMFNTPSVTRAELRARAHAAARPATSADS